MKLWTRHATMLVLLTALAACGGQGAGPGGPGTGGGTDVIVTPATGTVAVGGTLALSANQAVTWSTSSTSVATVNANGLVTGVGPATVTITATSQADPSRSASATLEVVCQTYSADALPGTISSDLTVPPGCHDLAGIKRVTSGATLTFEGPAVVRATNADAGIRVQDGTLRTLGEEATPVRFTSQSATPGSWHGFGIENGTSGTVLRHTTVEYAGRYSNAFHRRGGGSLFTGVRVEPNASATLDSVTIRRTGTGTGSGTEYVAGLFLERTANVTMTGDNRFIQNEGPGVALTASQLHMLSADADYGAAPAANVDNVVVVNDDSTSAPPVVTGSRSWPALNVPYRVVRPATIDGAGTVVTIAPGARFEFAADAGIRVQNEATLRAIGGSDAAERIVFTGTQASAGAWPGIHVNTTAANEIRNTDIEFAGQNSLSFNAVGGGGIQTSVRVGDGVGVGAGGGQAATLTFVDNVVRQSAGSGIRLEHPSTSTTPATVAQLVDQNDFQSATIAGADVDDAR